MTAPAALYVDPDRGPYRAMGLDLWCAARDARGYPGPGPVVAHPPCEAWGRFKWRARQDRRDLALIAVDQVRRWGGILEHPAHSDLWGAARLPRPGELPDPWGGWSLSVEQGWWGHEAPKATWLYLVGVDPNRVILPACRPTPAGRIEAMPRSRRHVTPPDFAVWLVSLLPRLTL